MVNRAQGCLMGQIAGDSLGSLVDGSPSKQIYGLYPKGIRELKDGGVWDTMAGQPSDASELALTLARTIVSSSTYDKDRVLKAYSEWYASKPFSRNPTVSESLQGKHNIIRLDHGALMRISPLGILCAHQDDNVTMDWAEQDATLTHLHPVCVQINKLFVLAIAHAIKSKDGVQRVYDFILKNAIVMKADPSVIDVIKHAANHPPKNFMDDPRVVHTAFHNALWQLLHSTGFEGGVINTVMRGGSTAVNAAVCGALLGSVYGINSVPAQWREMIAKCKPVENVRTIKRPRPEIYWPVDAMELASQIVSIQ